MSVLVYFLVFEKIIDFLVFKIIIDFGLQLQSPVQCIPLASFYSSSLAWCLCKPPVASPALRLYLLLILLLLLVQQLLHYVNWCLL
jgi:hypothetical protein